MNNPYFGLSDEKFWRNGVVESSPFELSNIYHKKWRINPSEKIATAGSCFAQHIARYMRSNGYNVLDVEPAPGGLPDNAKNTYGYSMYSARYGNIYTVRQLLQLLKEATGDFSPSTEDFVWKKNGRLYDAFRPNIEPDGFKSTDELLEHRYYHLKKVVKLFKNMDVFIFTLGLTESWMCRNTGIVFPTAPGTIAGDYDPEQYSFVNFSYKEVFNDFCEVKKILNRIREKKKPLKYLLTVSPVPLTATYSQRHILQASTYSKSVLRAVAGDLAEAKWVDYFPSFEIITNVASHGVFYENNLRSVRSTGVETVMKVFFSQHEIAHRLKDKSVVSNSDSSCQESEDVQCEEALLEAFGNKL